MPKVELHCHLEGCVRPKTLVALAKRNGVDLPTTDATAIYDYQDMASFLDVFERIGAALRTPADFARVTYEALADAAAANVVYREMFFNPTIHGESRYADLLAGICDGIEAAQGDHGIVARLIPSIYRGQGLAVALQLVEQVIAHPRAEVVGIGMDGDELQGPPEQFADAYQLAGEAGLRRTAHAGERFPGPEISVCLDLLGCTRIDHGYAVVDDPALLARCVDDGVHFTYAWLSTAYNYHGSPDRHPIPRMRSAGLSMSLGGDDPAMGGTTLTSDYLTVIDAFDWPTEVLREQTREALEAAWCDPATKASLQRRLAPPPPSPLEPALPNSQITAEES
jgi:adenosine deaminase